MNNNAAHKVLKLVLICFFLYFALSIIGLSVGINWKPLNKTNILSNVYNTAETHNYQGLIKKDKIHPNAQMLIEAFTAFIQKNTKAQIIPNTSKFVINGKLNHYSNAILKSMLESAKWTTKINNNLFLGNVDKICNRIFNIEKDFSLYKQSNLITNFNKKGNALPQLYKKLSELKKTGKGKIRIAYFGDSMIEGDRMSQNLRSYMQDYFGGRGVGYLPINCVSAKFRITASTSEQGWILTNFKSSNPTNLYISGYKFTGSGEGRFRDNTLKDNSLQIEKALIYGQVDNTKIEYNGNDLSIKGEESINRYVLSTDKGNTIHIKNMSDNFILYGVSFESPNGIIVDNFSFRGITGIELRNISLNTLSSINKNNPYDLIIFQYGVNLLFRPNDTNFSSYYNLFQNVIVNFQKAFPKADILIISTADRAFRYDGEYHSAIGVENLVKLQAKLAYNYNCAFYNQYESMGGKDSMVKWVHNNPPLAGKDYIHANAAGAKILSKKIFDALIKDYNNYIKIKKEKKNK